MASMPPPGLWEDGDRPAASGAIPQLGLLHRPQECRSCPLPTLQGAQRGPGGENYSEGTQGTATLLCSLHCRFNKATSQGSTDRNTGSQEISAGDPRVRNFSSNKEMRNLRPRNVRRFTQYHTTK